MTEDHKRLLAVFEVRVRDLMALCDQQKRRIDELTAALSLKDEELRQAKDMIEGLNAKCDNMLTARIVSTNEEEMKNARMRLSKLVREVDKCIALLNEGGKMSFKAVKKATKIKAEKDMYAAFGWLAKEGKLAFEEIEGEMYVSLV